MPPAHWLLALLAVFVWGTNFVVITWGLAELPPFAFSTLRFFFTAFPWVFLIKRPAIGWRPLAAFGAVIGAGQFGLLYFAMHRYITPGLASLLMQTQVVFTILIAIKIKRSRLRMLQLLALGLAAAGIAIVSWGSVQGTESTVTLFGIVLVLGAAFSWALANTIVQSVGTVNAIAFLVWSSLFALPPLLVLCFVFDGPMQSLAAVTRLDARGWGAVIWQVVGNTFFGFGVWNWLLGRHPAATVTPMALLVPVFGMTSSAWLLSEPLAMWKIEAAGLVLAGVALNAYSSTKKPNATSS